MSKEELIELIDEKVNEVYVAYQESEGIESGDMSLHYTLELDEMQEKLADLIIASMEMNKNNKEEEREDL